MHKPDVALWKNKKNDWSVEINDVLCEHVSSTVAHDLVEFALIADDQQVCAGQQLSANQISWTSVRLVCESPSEIHVTFQGAKKRVH